MPLLRYASQLTLTGTLPRWGDTPWASLRSLSLLPFSGNNETLFLEFGAQELRGILNAAVCLENLMLDFYVTHGTVGTGNREQVGHQTLRHLSFRLHHLQNDGYLFGMQVTAPQLRHITVIAVDEIEFDEGLVQIEAFQNVTSVTIDPIKVHEVPITVQFLRYLPKVTSIDVQGQNVDALFTLINGFYAHAPPIYSTAPLLKLTKVTIENADIRGKTLIKMLEARLAQLEGGFGWISAVTDVKLWDADNVTPEEWKKFHTLLESGRMVSLPDATAMPVDQSAA